MTGLVYAPGALALAARGRDSLWQLHRAALLRGQTPLVLAPVLAATMLPTGHRPTSGPAARLEALLAGCALVDFPVSAAWDVVRLRQLAPAADPVTAAVVLAALAARSIVVNDVAQPFQEIAERLGVPLGVATVTE
jgi:hypothetical protein